MPSPPLRILIAALGSHGDMHPFLALGRTLRDCGHEVRLIAPAMYESMARSIGLHFVPVGTAEEFERFSSRAGLWHPLKGFQVLAEGVAQLLTPYYRAIVENHEPGRTVLVLSSLLLAGRVAQEVLGAPAVSVHLSPVILRSIENPAKTPPLPVAAWLPKFWNRLVFAAADLLVLDAALSRPLNALRASVGLGPVKRIFSRWIHSPDRVIGLFPQWFAPSAADWPPQTVLTGFPLYDEADVTPIDAELEKFLDSGQPPIAFTPGSAMRHGGRFFAAAVQTCRMLGRRGLLVSIHGQQVPARLPGEIRYVRYAPFSRLLPRCAAIVHHAGIGTSSQALAAGIPQLAAPMAHDQADNAMRLQRLGVAEILPARRFAAPAAAVALEDVMDPIHRAACLVAKNRFAGKDPLRKSAEVIEQTFHDRAKPHL
ncbi:MAG: glycosyltransferase [Tepidisphaeraceae bacterium]|jgi:UDP:flavonoid glycosyltransferase YjiC (YdhE family)